MKAILACSSSEQGCLVLQELLKSQDRASSSDTARRDSEAAQTSADDLVPISAWFGQQSEPMDRRIAEEALLAGVDYTPESLDSSDAQGPQNASSGNGLAPGAAEGFTSAPLQQQQQSSTEDRADFQSRGAQSSKGLPWRGDEQSNSTSAGSASEDSSSEDSRAALSENVSQRASDTERRQEADTSSETEVRGSPEESAFGSYGEALPDEARGPASQQEVYREEGSPADNGECPACKPEGLKSHVVQDLACPFLSMEWQSAVLLSLYHDRSIAGILQHLNGTHVRTAGNSESQSPTAVLQCVSAGCCGLRCAL